MRIDMAFPSTYLKAADLQSRAISVLMDRVEMREVGDELKPVLYFIGKEKGLVLNKTNATTISGMYGYDTDSWHNKKICIRR